MPDGPGRSARWTDRGYRSALVRQLRHLELRGGAGPSTAQASTPACSSQQGLPLARQVQYPGQASQPAPMGQQLDPQSAAQLQQAIVWHLTQSALAAHGEPTYNGAGGWSFASAALPSAGIAFEKAPSLETIVVVVAVVVVVVVFLTEHLGSQAESSQPQPQEPAMGKPTCQRGWLQLAIVEHCLQQALPQGRRRLSRQWSFFCERGGGGALNQIGSADAQPSDASPAAPAHAQPSASAVGKPTFQGGVDGAC